MSIGLHGLLRLLRLLRLLIRAADSVKNILQYRHIKTAGPKIRADYNL
eukprot:COSAG01_NODE_6577_length_3598_cov_9.061732_5_plen_48_part_00